MKDARLAERCHALKLILTDVDGVMTDGTFLLLPDGTEARSFHIRDGMGIVLAHRAGLRTGLITGRSSASVEKRAAELRMAVVRQGVRDKLACLGQILKTEGLSIGEVAFIGDDLNDLAVIQEVGLSAAPADAPFEVRSAAFMVTDAPGGRGCLREFIEAILRARGEWESVLAAMGAQSLA